jgi:hypothetical protein
MEKSLEPLTWQEFLGQLIEDIPTRERMAEAAHIRSITLQRWASGISKPREENMRTLLKILPTDSYALFSRLVAIDFPDLLLEDPTSEQVYQELPSEFYARVLSALALTPLPMCRQTVQDLIFRQALEQLDPERRGLSLSLVCCVAPRHGEHIRSLREIGGVGTPPWPSDLAQRTMFLGAESLVGYVLNSAHYGVINSREEPTFLPANWTEHEQSVVAFPISRYSRVAGSLLVSSARSHFFSPARISLVEHYAHLASLIFEPEEFYELGALDLKMMPSENIQAPYFRDFNQRVSRKLSEAAATRHQIALQEARQLVWRDLEEDLLQVFLRIGMADSSEPLP